MELIVPRAVGGSAVKRSAPHVSTEPAATLRLEPACVSLALLVAAARTLAQQAGMGLVAR